MKVSQTSSHQLQIRAKTTATPTITTKTGLPEDVYKSVFKDEKTNKKDGDQHGATHTTLTTA